MLKEGTELAYVYQYPVYSLFADLRRTNFYETFEKKINEKRALLKESGKFFLALCYLLQMSIKKGN